MKLALTNVFGRVQPLSSYIVNRVMSVDEHALLTVCRYSVNCLAGRSQHAMLDGAVVTLTTSDILQWLTGSNMIPAIGLHSKITVTFSSSRVLPHVSTCGPYVEFPVNVWQHARKSVSVFTRWILDSSGFGQA